MDCSGLACLLALQLVSLTLADEPRPVQHNRQQQQYRDRGSPPDPWGSSSEGTTEEEFDQDSDTDEQAMDLRRRGYAVPDDHDAADATLKDELQMLLILFSSASLTVCVTGTCIYQYHKHMIDKGHKQETLLCR